MRALFTNFILRLSQNHNTAKYHTHFLLISVSQKNLLFQTPGKDLLIVWHVSKWTDRSLENVRQTGLSSAQNPAVASQRIQSESQMPFSSWQGLPCSDLIIHHLSWTLPFGFATFLLFLEFTVCVSLMASALFFQLPTKLCLHKEHLHSLQVFAEMPLSRRNLLLPPYLKLHIATTTFYLLPSLIYFILFIFIGV